MTDETDYYKSPHQVLVTLKHIFESDVSASALKTHREYYTITLKSNLVSYSDAMNTRAICILLNVNDDDDFENIITNDPALISGRLEVDTVIPFTGLAI